MVNDTIAEKLEARGLWRRAAARWLDVMLCCATDAERDWISQRRRYCLSMISSPRPDNKMDICAIHRAAIRTQQQMGIDVPTKINIAEKSFEKKSPRI